MYVPGMQLNGRFIPGAIALVVAIALATGPAGAGAEPGTKEPKSHRVDLIGETKTVGGSILASPATDKGTVTGKPFGDGRIKLVVQLDLVYRTFSGTFRIRTDRGTAVGTLEGTITGLNRRIDYDGTADFTGGKGRYKGITGTDLEVRDSNTLDDDNGPISFEGYASW